MQFTPEYEERTTLRDGTPVYLRLVGPEDREAIQQGLEQLSAETRYRRFLGPKKGFSQSELDALTQLDGHDHLAIGIGQRLKDGTEDPWGVGRFVRLAPQSPVATFAVVVIDARQSQGVGTLLIRRLGAAALERGIETFQAEVLKANTEVLQLMRDLAPGTEIRRASDNFELMVPVKELARGPA